MTDADAAADGEAPAAPPRPRGAGAGIALLGTLLLAAIACRLLVYRGLDGTLALGWPPDVELASLRAGAVLTGAVVGVLLALAGVMLQALLRNPLASPFVLGVSSGAALGVMTASWAAWRFGATWALAGGEALPATLGALAALAIVFLLGRQRGRPGGGLDPVTLLLVGVVVAAIGGSLSTWLQFQVPTGLRADFLAWITGTVRERPSAPLLATAGALGLLALAAVAWTAPTLDALALGEDEARSVGVPVARVRSGLLVASGVVTAAAVALAGPIGFVGLVAPHLARTLVGPRHRGLAVAAALAGAAMLVGADAVAQVARPGGGRLPVGVFTALCGGPIFIWMLRSSGARTGGGA